MCNREDKVGLDQSKEATADSGNNRSMGKISKDQYPLEYFDQVALEIC